MMKIDMSSTKEVNSKTYAIPHLLLPRFNLEQGYNVKLIQQFTWVLCSALAQNA